MKKNNHFEIVLTISTGLLIFYIILLNKYPILQNKAILIGLICFNLANLFIKPFRRLIADGWMKLAEIMGAISSKILLSIVFIFILIPIALLFQLFRKDNLMIKNKHKSTFINRNYLYNKKDMDQGW